MTARAGWVLYLTLLLAWLVSAALRRRRAAGAKDPATPGQRDPMLALFVIGWAVILFGIAIAWWIFHPR